VRDAIAFQFVQRHLRPIIDKFLRVQAPADWCGLGLRSQSSFLAQPEAEKPGKNSSIVVKRLIVLKRKSKPLRMMEFGRGGRDRTISAIVDT
jgi:hypothetical protein